MTSLTRTGCAPINVQGRDGSPTGAGRLPSSTRNSSSSPSFSRISFTYKKGRGDERTTAATTTQGPAGLPPRPSHLRSMKMDSWSYVVDLKHIRWLSKESLSPGITFGYLLCPVIRRECRDSIFGGFTTVLGMFFDGLGCFWPWRQRGIAQRLAAQSGRKVWKNWEKTCRLSPEDASGSECCSKAFHNRSPTTESCPPAEFFGEFFFTSPFFITETYSVH
jgi:hypothetical protein